MRLSFAMEPDRKVQDRQRNERPFNRRAFLRSGIIFSGAALTGVGLLHGTEIEKKSEEKEAEVGPHEAREDTVLFPAFRKIVSPHEFDSLGEDFEKKEDELFGDDGFEKMVDKVASIEKRFGIYDLAQFTPKI